MAKKRGQTPFPTSSENQRSSWEGIASVPEPTRADKYLSETLTLMSRSQLKARSACLFCNGKEVKLSHKIKNGDHLRLEWTDAPPEEITPEPIPLAILYHDADVFVINKPQGMVTHPAAGNWSGTLANGALWLSLHSEDARATGIENEAKPQNEHELNRSSTAISEFKTEPELEPVPFYTSFGTLPSENQPPPRAGIVHRLDKDTSGIIIVARTARAHEFLSRQFHDREARKEYLAIVRGTPPTTEGRIDTWLARSPHDRKKFAVSPPGRGKHALTLYKVRAIWEIPARPSDASQNLSQRPRSNGALSSDSTTMHARSFDKTTSAQRYTLIALYPRTGRTHQLRVHMVHLGCPILGDPIYSKKDPRFPDATLMLHARRLKIRLPADNEFHIFAAPLPEHFKHMIAVLDTQGIRRRAST